MRRDQKTGEMPREGAIGKGLAQFRAELERASISFKLGKTQREIHQQKTVWSCEDAELILPGNALKINWPKVA